MTHTTRFIDLNPGRLFRFFEGGSLLTKGLGRRYSAPQWGQHDLVCYDENQPVIVYEDEMQLVPGVIGASS